MEAEGTVQGKELEILARREGEEILQGFSKKEMKDGGNLSQKECYIERGKGRETKQNRKSS